MEAPDSVPGTPRGGEPRRPLPLRQARLPAAPSAGGPALIVLVPQGPGELRQADWLPCSPCRPSQVGSARLHPAPLSQVCACTPSLFLQMPVALCLQNLSATEAPMAAVPLRALRTALLAIPPQLVPWPQLGQLRTLLGKASGQDSG